MGKQKIGDNSKIPLEMENISPSITVATGSPITQMNGVEVSMPNKTTTYCY